MTAFYFETRYPPGPAKSYSKKEAKEVLKKGKEVIDRIEDILNIKKSQKKVKKK